MAQDELFEALPQKISLPPLEYGPIRCALGQIGCRLRDGSEVSVVTKGTVAISARTNTPVYELSTGERFISTTRRNVVRPPGIDGVLHRRPDGQFVWHSHAMIDAIEAKAKAKGWPATMIDRASQWDDKVRFCTERPNANGTVDDDKRGLRPPQLGALHAIGAHWSLYKQAATVVMPTGTGKTETMLAALAAYIRKPLLVVVPSDALRTQTARKFQTLGLLRYLGVLAPDAPNPVIGIITKVPKSATHLDIFERCNVIIGTMDALSAEAAESLFPEIVKRVGCLVIDEAHHIGATRWAKFKKAFAEVPILQFTATPFRRDGVLVDGQVIYNYPLRMAQADQYFKPISFAPVYEPAPSRSDQAIAELAIKHLRADLKNGLDHLMMARCMSIDRAEAVLAIYRSLAPELKPLLIHSDLPDAAQRTAELQARRSRIAVCVNMLGEGFDLPQLKVAAIHDLHKSLAVLLQFTGRFTRSAAPNIGNATVVANIAEPNVSRALERLYSEDADWNQLLSELSSDAVQEHAKLVAFLNDAKRLDERAIDEDTAISHQLLRPTLSTLFFRCDAFTPKQFIAGLPPGLRPYRVWYHEKSSTLYFVTRSEPAVKWARSKTVRDREWGLIVLHHDSTNKLLYLSATDHVSNFTPLAKAAGASTQISGDTIFRAMGRINRLIFLNVGVRKHGRRNLSYATYTGAEVLSQLTLAEKSGSVKALLNGMGWEGGKQISIGCSAKGRVWSREQGTIPRLNEWCESVGAKVLDDAIDPSKLIDNVLIPTEVTDLPETELLCIDWPVDLLRKTEELVMFRTNGRQKTQTTFDLVLGDSDRSMKAITFTLVEATTDTWGKFRFALGGAQGFSVEQIGGDPIAIQIGKLEPRKLAEYFSDYPPLFRFVDLSELDAVLHITPQNPSELAIDDNVFDAWDWKPVDIKKESIWKDGQERRDSIQWHVAQHFIQSKFDVVFDDDASGEAADLVCLKIEDDHIRLVLVHCKFSGTSEVGERVRDVVEVASQALRSARWAGRLPQLCQHVKHRNEALKATGSTSRFMEGSAAQISAILKLHRFRPVRPEILIVQPGLSKAKRTQHQSMVLASAISYVKQTVGANLAIICSA